MHNSLSHFINTFRITFHRNNEVVAPCKLGYTMITALHWPDCSAPWLTDAPQLLFNHWAKRSNLGEPNKKRLWKRANRCYAKIFPKRSPM